MHFLRALLNQIFNHTNNATNCHWCLLSFVILLSLAELASPYYVAVLPESLSGCHYIDQTMLMMLLQDKWGKPHKGKVLLCHPEGDAHPHLQLKTGSGVVVSTARVYTALKPQVSSSCSNHKPLKHRVKHRLSSHICVLNCDCILMLPAHIVLL